MTEISGSLLRTEFDSMNLLRVEALRERDVEACKLRAAIASMESAIRILSDTTMDHSDRVYEARAYLRSRIEMARSHV